MPDAGINSFVLTVDEFLERYRAGERNFAGVGLFKNREYGTIIEDAELTSINLSGADLGCISFKNVVLKDARMFGACLYGARFDMVDMEDGAYLAGATLVRVYMRSSSLIGARLQRANLSFAVLENVELDAVLLEECNLTRANLSKVGTRNGEPYSMYQLRAEYALLWNTTLPNCQQVTGPIIYDSGHHRETIG
jgi:uncharacterized protein YjbI with pentapeptide repeats